MQRRHTRSPELLSVYMKCSMSTYQSMCMETVHVWALLFSLVRDVLVLKKMKDENIELVFEWHV